MQIAYITLINKVLLEIGIVNRLNVKVFGKSKLTRREPQRFIWLQRSGSTRRHSCTVLTGTLHKRGTRLVDVAFTLELVRTLAVAVP